MRNDASRAQIYAAPRGATKTLRPPGHEPRTGSHRTEHVGGGLVDCRDCCRRLISNPKRQIAAAGLEAEVRARACEKMVSRRMDLQTARPVGCGMKKISHLQRRVITVLDRQRLATDWAAANTISIKNNISRWGVHFAPAATRPAEGNTRRRLT